MNYFNYDTNKNGHVNVLTQPILKVLQSNHDNSQAEPILSSYEEFDAVIGEAALILENASDDELCAIGCMMGMAIGDALGMPLEFTPVRYGIIDTTDMKDKTSWNMRAGQFTDDTSMGLCLADSIIVNGKFDQNDIMLRYVGWWYFGYNTSFRFDEKRYTKNAVGLGGTIGQSLTEFIHTGIAFTKIGDNNSSGNGSIMRNAPIPIAYRLNLQKAIMAARLQSLCTHRGDEAGECCMLLTYICIQWFTSKDDLTKILDTCTSSNKNIQKLLSSEYPWNWKQKNFRYDEKRSRQQPTYIGSYSTDCMAMAFHCIVYTNTFSDALIKAVNIGGDADSLGSVVGQLAGSYYGYSNIPRKWIRDINKWTFGTIVTRAHNLYEMAHTLQ
jgi:ADP-ribosyl-[dinitrogen reductase] hydrolase